MTALILIVIQEDLNTSYYLTPLPKKSLRAELTGDTKSNNYVGSLVTLTFTNQKYFQGRRAARSPC